MNISADCANGQDIRASYEISYTSSCGTSITTFVVNGNCSNGVCHHELQDNNPDSRCQPPVSQFNSENVTVTVTARNIVGSSSVSRSISEMSVALLWSVIHLEMKYISSPVFFNPTVCLFMALASGHSHALLFRTLKLPSIRFYVESGVFLPAVIPALFT